MESFRIKHGLLGVVFAATAALGLLACTPQSPLGTTPSGTPTTATSSATTSVAVVPGTPGTKQIASQYVGQATCQSCHSAIGTTYLNTGHYKQENVNTRTDRGLTTHLVGRAADSCALCHATGADAAKFGSTIPFDYVTNSTDSTPNSLLRGTGCESCHGPGANHVAASTIADRKATIMKLPSYTTCMACHAGEMRTYRADGTVATTSTETSSQGTRYTFPETGVPESTYMLGGAHAKLGMSPVGAVYTQSGGYTGGTAVAFTNAHKTKIANGCVSCHMAGAQPDSHNTIIASRSAVVMEKVCTDCHTGMNESSMQAYQGQTKLALARMRDALVSYRSAHVKWVIKSSATTSVAADIANISNAPALWDDSDAYVQGLASAAGASKSTNYTDKARWTDGGSHWSNRQKLYNQAYWNYSLANSEGSYGIHAPSYTQYLLRSSYNALVADMGTITYVSTPSFSILNFLK